jgi:phytoene dehydrogenase-like protein
MKPSLITLSLTILIQQTDSFVISPTAVLSSSWHQFQDAYSKNAIDRADRRTPLLLRSSSSSSSSEEHVDIAIVGAGIGGLCAGAILNTLYNKKVGIYESHYLPGGCAHAFPHVTNNDQGEKVSFTFDSGPTIVLGCSKKPYNPLRQVLNAIGLAQEVDWIPYTAWGMIEHPNSTSKERRWRVELGPDLFEQGPLSKFGGLQAQKEFQELRILTKDLVSGAVAIPAMAMRSGDSAIIPLLRYLPALIGLIQQGPEATQGTFAPFMDGPKYVVKSQWLRDWLDALAFSLSGLPASRTAAAAMAYVLYDMHRDGAALDYPKGGLGEVIDALVKGVEQGDLDSRVHLRAHVQSIDTTDDGSKAVGLTLKNGKKIIAKDGVICNAPVWALTNLICNDNARSILNSNSDGSDNGEMLGAKVDKDRKPRQSWATQTNVERKNVINFERPSAESGDIDSSLLAQCDTSEQTGSFLHLHVALNSTDLDLDSLEAHYTVMDRGLSGDDDGVDGPCGELNMIAVSNPCVLDRSLAPKGYIVVHAYGAGNEPYGMWENLERNSQEYKDLKEERAGVLWNAIESIIPDARERTVTSMIGSPLTHERFLRRPRGTYGSATEDYLKDGRTPIKGLVLCGKKLK